MSKKVEIVTKEDIEKWSKEILNLKIDDHISPETWSKIQKVATYIFNKNQIKN